MLAVREQAFGTAPSKYFSAHQSYCFCYPEAAWENLFVCFTEASWISNYKDDNLFCLFGVNTICIKRLCCSEKHNEQIN